MTYLQPVVGSLGNFVSCIHVKCLDHQTLTVTWQSNPSVSVSIKQAVSTSNILTIRPSQLHDKAIPMPVLSAKSNQYLHQVFWSSDPHSYLTKQSQCQCQHKAVSIHTKCPPTVTWQSNFSVSIKQSVSTSNILTITSPQLPDKAILVSVSTYGSLHPCQVHRLAQVPDNSKLPNKPMTIHDARPAQAIL